VGSAGIVLDVADEAGDSGFPGEDCEGTVVWVDPHVNLFGGEETEGGAVYVGAFRHLLPDTGWKLYGFEVSELVVKWNWK
jgi:hypothetical protein